MKTLKKIAFSLITLLTAGQAVGANTSTAVDQVTSAVTVADDVDYHITGTVPFTADGSIDITATDHAVLIFDNVKPSKLLAYLKYIKINGAAAVNNSTCQVKIYNRGSILLPYSKDIKPLTVYSGTNFTGTAVNDFGLEHNGGFMSTLTEAKLNNKIRSFKLKRGYMVTFSTRAGGYGYNRCFIADNEDLEFAEMPAILDRSISSYRIFKWNDAGKKGLANDTRSESNNALGSTWCYSFGLGEDTGIDRECVPHHIYEGWPAIADCAKTNYTTSSPTMKTNNEPGNSADDHPQSVATVLANWEQHMATGMRLCSPSSHDGSLGWLKEFMDSIDARGWRCDVLDVHSYWPSGSFYGLSGWYDKYHRPIWISEWCWGASWNRNGVFNPSLSDADAMSQNAAMVKELCELMDGYDFIERYSFWNSEADRSKLYLNGQLTEAGKNYAALEGKVGYNRKYDYVPRIPKAKGAPYNLSCVYDAAKGVSVLRWHEKNGEYNKSMTIERRETGKPWQTLVEIDLEEDEADYMYEDTETFYGAEYRVHVVYADGKDYYTAKTAKAVPASLAAGDAVSIDGNIYYIGGNILPNGDFDFGTMGWTNGEGGELSLPHFQVFDNGGYDGKTYLQAYSHEAADKVGSLKTIVDVVPGADYYYSAASIYDGMTNNKLSLTTDGTNEDEVVASMSNYSIWTKYDKKFNTGTYSKAMLSFRYLGAKACFDQLSISRLFDNKAEAVADGVKAEKARAEMLLKYNTGIPSLNDELSSVLSTATDDEQSLSMLTTTVNNITEAIRLKNYVDSVSTVYAAVSAEGLEGTAEIGEAFARIEKTSSAADYVNEVLALKDMVATWLPFSEVQMIQYPSFAQQSIVWKKSGTYSSGSQKVDAQDDMTFWSALWTDNDGEDRTDKTMAITQDIQKNTSGDYLAHGLYVLRCKAATHHGCISDQHAYILHNGDSISSPILSTDRFDVALFANDGKWETLTTRPVYINERDALTIGFSSSRNGATANAWKPYGEQKGSGDGREGSWNVTDFALCHIPVYHCKVDDSGWSTICLPYDAKPTEGVKLYQIAGRLATGAICLEEIYGIEAGKPCVIYSDHEEAVILESGAKVDKRVNGENGLLGLFITSATAPKNSVVLRNGAWVVQDSDNREDRAKMSDFSAYIKSIDNVPTIESWDGVMLPMTSLTGIDRVSSEGAISGSLFTVDGRRVATPSFPGIYIKVINGNAKKICR